MSISTAFHTTRTGLQFQETNLAIKAQNIAAQGVDGYKKEYLLGMTLAYKNSSPKAGYPSSDSGSTTPTELSIGLGVQSAGTYRSFSQGDPIKTDEPLDLMIDGNGFFVVNLPNGQQAYTRIGSLQKNVSGQLVMPKTGYTMSPGITVPSSASDISINRSGQVFILTPSSPQPQQVGQLEIATFLNPSGLQPIDDSLFLETQASGTANTGAPGSDIRGALKQGWREGSNVNAVEEMTDLIKIEKIYDMLTKVLKAGDAMMESTTRIRS